MVLVHDSISPLEVAASYDPRELFHFSSVSERLPVDIHDSVSSYERIILHFPIGISLPLITFPERLKVGGVISLYPKVIYAPLPIFIENS